MAGDTFDAGTVLAEARLSRDEFQRDLDKLRRDMAKFERETFKVNIGADQSDLDAGTKQARTKMRNLGREKAEPKVGLNDRIFKTRIFSVRAMLKQINEIVSTPLILVDIVQSLARVAKLKYELRDLASRYVIEMVIYPQIFREVNDLANGLLSVKNVARTLIPILAPLLTGAAGSAAIMASSLASAGGAAGIFALAAIPALTSVVEKSKEIEDAQKKVTEALTDEQRKTALAELDLLMKGLSEQEKAAVQDVNLIKTAWRDFQTAIQPAVFGLLGNSVGLIQKLLPPLVPVVVAVADVFGRWIDDMEGAIDRGGLTRFTDWLAGPGVQALDTWGRAIGNFGAGFINVLMGASGPTADFNEGLLRMSENFLAWSQALGQNQQWQEFLTFTQAVMPDVLTILGQLIPILWSIHQTFAPITIAVLDFVAGFMQAHPAVAEFLIVGFAVSQFFMGLVGIIAGVVIKILLFAAIMGRIGQVFTIVRTAQALWSAVMLRDFAAVGRIAVQLFTQIMRLTAVGRLFTVIANATKIWAAAQWLLNTALFASPITWIVAGILLLVAAFVLAYQNSETFRNIVTAAWEGIKAAAMAAWDGYIKPALDWFMQALRMVGDAAVWLWQNAMVPAWNGIMTAVQAVGQWFQWLWDTIISPVFNFISLAARVLLAVLVTAVLAPIILAVKGLGLVFSWLWESVIQPVWGAIAGFISEAWTGTIQPVLAAIGTFITTNVGAAWTWLSDTVSLVWTTITTAISTAWNWLVTTIFQPLVDWLVGILAQSFEGWKIIVLAVWDAVSSGIGIAWAFIRDNIWNPIVEFLSGVLSPAFQAGSDAAVAAWNMLRDALAAVWDWLRTNVFDPIITFVRDTLVAAFNTAIDGIRTAWNKIQEIVGPPIKFMVGVVYNEGIVPAWNWIADLVGLGKLNTVNLAFAEGGRVPGQGDRDTVPAMLTPGEFVLSKPAVKAAGGLGAVDSMHQMLRSGFFNTGGPVVAYQVGGPVGPAPAPSQGGLDSLWSVVTGGLAKMTGMFTNTLWGKAAIGLVKTATDRLWPFMLEKIASFFASMIGVGGGAGGGAMVAGGGDARAWIIARESGGNPTAQNPTSTASGLYQFINGTWKAYGGSTPTAKQASVAEQNAVADRYVASRYGSWEAAKAFHIRNGWYDQGGIIPPGTSVVHNRTGRPELAGRLDQWASLIDSARVQHPGADGTSTLSAASVERLNATMIEIRDMLERRGAGATINVEDRSGSPTETGRAAALAIRLS